MKPNINLLSNLSFQPFKKFAQIGRVIYINEGQYKGKLAVIVDIIDTNRVSSILFFFFFFKKVSTSFGSLNIKNDALEQ